MKPSARSQPQFIFIGESHYDFSYISLADRLLKSCEERGLKVAIFSEFQSQSEKIANEKRNWLISHPTIAGAVDNEPKNSGVICDYVDRHLAKHNKLPGYFERYHPIQEEARISALETEAKSIAALDRSALNFEQQKKAVEMEGMENWSQKIFPQLMAQRDGDYVGIIKYSLREEDCDVAIIWTGGAHIKPVMEGLGISQETAIILSNQDSRKIGGLSATKFAVDETTKAVSLPDSVEKQLAELQIPKESFVEKLGLQKPDEKPRSFVEAMQAGKYGKMKSPGGAHEL